MDDDDEPVHDGKCEDCNTDIPPSWLDELLSLGVEELLCESCWEDLYGE